MVVVGCALGEIDQIREWRESSWGSGMDWIDVR